MAEGYQALTEKEKQTLRLVVRGYDAKTMARQLGLSIHTINERLRTARRKLSVTSSREAARMVLHREAGTPQFVGDKELGEAPSEDHGDDVPPLIGHRGDGRHGRRTVAWLAGGILAMSLLVAFLVLSSPLPTASSADGGDARPPAVAAADAAVEEAARAWLALTDASDWEASYAATGSQFREMNTLEVWSDASDEARAPLGAVLSREAIGYRDLYAPPHGYREVQFRSDFAGRKGVVETVTLEREGDQLRVVAYIID